MKSNGRNFKVGDKVITHKGDVGYIYESYGTTYRVMFETSNIKETVYVAFNGEPSRVWSVYTKKNIRIHSKIYPNASLFRKLYPEHRVVDSNKIEVLL